MSSLLHQLENNEAIALLYLADELPPEDRAEVEAMLATDGRLRAEVEALRHVWHRVEEGLQSLDHQTRSSSQERVLGRTGRVIRKWAVDRLRPMEVPEEEPGRRFPLWGYPVAMAAAVGLLLMIWWQALPTEDETRRLVVVPGGAVAVDPEVLILADSVAVDPFAEDELEIERIEQELAAMEGMEFGFGLDENR